MNYDDCMWAYIKGDLDRVFGYDGIDWELFGFRIEDIRWAVSRGYQSPNNDGIMISLFPIYNLNQFNEATGFMFNSHPDFKIVTSEEAFRINSELILKNAENEIELAKIPSEDDIYKSQILLLLTKLSVQLEERSQDSM